MSNAGAMISVQSAQVAAQNALVLQTNLLRFFHSRNALSAKNAIVVTDLDWLEMGMNFAQNNIFFGGGLERLFKLYAINKTDNGRYWLDAVAFEHNVKMMQEKQVIAVKWILIISIILFLVLGFLLPWLIAL